MSDPRTREIVERLRRHAAHERDKGWPLDTLTVYEDATAEIERLAAEVESGKKLGVTVAEFCDWLIRKADELDAKIPSGGHGTQGSCALTAALVYLSEKVAGPDTDGDPSPDEYIERCQKLWVRDVSLRADRDRLAAELEKARELLLDPVFLNHGPACISRRLRPGECDCGVHSLNERRRSFLAPRDKEADRG